MLGIPGQHPESLRTTLEQVAGLVDHVSAYLLSVEPGTEFERLAGRGDLDLPPESEVIELLAQADRGLRSEGFNRYEVSNWSLPGFECRHNLMYWSRGQYAGFGAGAHSYRSGVRYSRVEDPEEYAERLARGADPVDMRERLTGEQAVIEEIMLGLRTERGLDVSALREASEIDRPVLEATVADLAGLGLLTRNGNFVQLSPKGTLVCDSVTEAFSLSALSR
jgi:oxygen-independent coproporphyrinogen-3 oxidase